MNCEFLREKDENSCKKLLVYDFISVFLLCSSEINRRKFMIRKSLTLLVGLTLATSLYATDQKTICGETDDRTPSYNPKVARSLGSMTAPAGCTITMIGKTCAISAGHCHTTFGFAEFNTPLSADGRIQHPDQEDIYEIDKSTLQYANRGQGNDWAVVRIKPNSITRNIQERFKVTTMSHFKCQEKETW